MRTLNLRLLAGLVALSTLLGVGGYCAHQWQVRRMSAALRAQAVRAEAEGRLPEARAALERYLALRPRDTDVLAHYSSVLDRLAATPAERGTAFLAYEQTLQRDPARRAVRRRLAELALELGRSSDARAHLEILLRTTPDDGPLEFLQGRCSEAEGDDQGAAAWYEKARTHSPHRLDAFERLAGLARGRLRAPDQADRVIDEMVAANPDSVPALLDRAGYRRRFQLPGVESDLEHARRLAPDAADVLLETARTARERPDLDEARKLLQRATALYPGDARMVSVLAEVELLAGRPDEALACLQRGLEQDAGQVDLRWSLANLLADRGATTDLTEQIDRLRQARFPTGPLDYLVARLRINQGEWRQARALLEQAPPNLGAWPDLKRLSYEDIGRCCERLGDLDRRCEAYRRAVQLDPLAVSARLGLAAALAAQGKLDEAIEDYRRLLPRVPAVRAELARLLTARNRERPAEDRRWDEIDALWDENKNESVESALVHADSLAARGRIDAARALLEKVRARDPRQVGPWLALARLAGRQAAPALLDEARQALGDRVELRLARIQAQTDGPEAVRVLKEQVNDLERFTGDDQRALLRELSAAFVRVGDRTEAARLSSRLAEQAPEDLNARLVLFDLALQAGDGADLSRRVADIQRVEGAGGVQGRYAEARRLIWLARRGDAGAADQARVLLTDLAADRPEWTPAPLALAELDDRAGDHAAALTHYSRAVALGARTPAVLRRTVQLLFAARRFAEADEVLRKLPEAAPLTGDLQRLATGIALQTQDPARALTLAAQTVAAHPDDYRERLWLGRVLWAAGHRAEAEAALVQAVQLAGDAPDAWIALVQYHARMGQTEKAEAALQRAESVLPKGQAPLALAQCHDALGHVEQARALFETARAAQPDALVVLQLFVNFLIRNHRIVAAESRLRESMDRKGKPAADAAWARRTLALVLTLEGDYRKARAALDLLAEPDDSADEQRIRARVLVAQKTRRQRAEAVRVFERLAEREPLAADDRFLLAQLHDLDGDWPKALELWRDVVSSGPPNPEYLAEFAAALRRHGQTDEARSVCDRLEALEPRAPRTVLLKARVLHDLDRTDEAVALLKAGSTPARAAAACEEWGRFDVAESLHRQARRPADLLAFAEFLGRRNRPQEALDLCDPLWDAAPSEAVAQTCVNVLNAARRDEKSTRRVADRLDRARAQHPASSALMLNMAIIRELQGRDPDAEALYREAIARGVENVAAFNNLAWLVALQAGQGDEALALSNRAIERAGPLPELLDTRAVAALAAGQPRRAIDDLTEAVATAAAAPMYFHLAQAYLKVSDRKAAAAALEKARQSGLVVSGLHPLEQTAYQQLVLELGSR